MIRVLKRHFILHRVADQFVSSIVVSVKGVNPFVRV